MIVPQYWSESKVKKMVGGKSFTIKRFGWSDTSEDEAQQHAQTRLQEAVVTLEREGNVRRIDHKTSYNGAEGLPIREEVVLRYEDEQTIISRNSYGALCLNTPDVFFADVDFDYNIEPSIVLRLIAFLLLCAPTVAIGLMAETRWIFYVAIFLVVVLSNSLATFIHNRLSPPNETMEKKALDTIKNVSVQNPDLHLRVYRTPLGYRVLLMQDTYSPTCESTIALLNHFKSDRIYIQMCKNQNCFRARVSPKPWRIGIGRLRPRPGVWPIKAERMAVRQRWIKDYDKKATSFASCHYVMHLGSDKVDPKALSVQKIHDDLCNAHNAELQIA